MFRHKLLLVIFIISSLYLFSSPRSGGPGKGVPVSISLSNPYYFCDPAGKPLILLGDYTWETFSSPNSDFPAMFRSLKDRGLNLARIWLWWGCEEFPPPDRKVHIEPFLREGPGLAADGKPKYNLDKFNPAFFSRLTAFCREAEKNGIILQLMMFDAWMIKHPHLWKLNAFNAANNTNGVDGDPGKTGKGTDGKHGFCSMGNPEAMKYQKAYIKKVVETVNEFNLIYFEIANENYYNEEWELTLCDYIKELERSMPKRHMTIRRDFPSHSYVIQKWDPDLVRKGIMDKRYMKVPLLFDTDWIINNNDHEVRKAAWTSIVSGGHFSYMDDAMEFRTDTVYKDKRAELHKQIDIMAAFIKPLKPWEMVPDNSLVKSGKCFAMGNSKMIAAFAPNGGELEIDISGLKGNIVYKWYDTLTGKFSKPAKMKNSGTARLKSPADRDWALLIQSR